MEMTDIHSCSYHCDRLECIKAQRDELRERLAQPEQESFSPEAIRATQAAWKMGYDAAKAEQPEQEPVARLTCEELGYVPLSADGKSVYIDGVGLVRLAQPEQSVAGYCKKIEELIAERDSLRAALAQLEQDAVLAEPEICTWQQDGGRATAAEAALQMTKATHALKIDALERQRDALREALISFTKSAYIRQQHPKRFSAAVAAIKAAEGEKEA